MGTRAPITGESLQQFLVAGEGQTVEFKTSLAETAAATQTLVAFSNADRGKVLFGVKPDGTVSDVSIGNNTLEQLAARIKDHTYPSLMPRITALDHDGRQIVLVECVGDALPISGSYLYSGTAIAEDRPVDATTLQSYRRVGRTNQKVDFMRERRSQPTDPCVVLGLTGAGSGGKYFPKSAQFSYHNSGPGWARGVTLSATHPAYQIVTGPRGVDLPPPDQEVQEFEGRTRRGKIGVVDADLDLRSSAPALLEARFSDLGGLTWRSTLEMKPVRRDGAKKIWDFVAGFFECRIAAFPAKRP